MGFDLAGHVKTMCSLLSSVIRNNSSVFTAFIDLKKAFDFVDRNMLLYKLLQSNINGKMYDSIKTYTLIRPRAYVSMINLQSGLTVEPV